jgi:hypothetical protein
VCLSVGKAAHSMLSYAVDTSVVDHSNLAELDNHAACEDVACEDTAGIGNQSLDKA